MAEKIQEGEEKLLGIAKRQAEVTKGMSDMHAGALYGMLDKCGKKNKEGDFIGLSEDADPAKVSADMDKYMQMLFYTKLVGMSPEKFKKFQAEFMGEGGDVNGTPVGDILGDANGLPGQRNFMQLIQKLYMEGVQGFEKEGDKLMAEFQQNTMGKVLSTAAPRTKEDLDALLSFVKKYNPQAKEMGLENVFDPKEAVKLYANTVPYALQASRN